jgi:predicted O-linked N-acetylglucosamine transferase (SPINDLY family)
MSKKDRKQQKKNEPGVGNEAQLDADFLYRQEMQTAIAHHAAGRLDQAEAIYRHVLKWQPEHAGALHLLGLIAHQRGNSEAAIQLLGLAIRLSPATADFHANLGLIYHSINRMPEAAAALNEAVKLNPGHADALNNLGSALKALGRGEEAVACYRRAVAVRPDFRLAHLNLAGMLWDLRRFDESVAAYRMAVTQAPGDPALHFRFANLLRDLGRPDEAAAHFRRAIELEPSYFEAHANLGNALRDLGQVEPAIASYREAVRLRPDVAECHLNLATGLLSIGLVEESLASSRTAIRIKPTLDEGYTTMLLALHYRVHPLQEMLDAHRSWSEARAQNLPRVQRLNPSSASGRLRVGFISPDFFDHPIAYFLEPLLAEHNRERLEFTCYSSVARPDAFTQRLQSHADRWRNVSALPHDQVAGLIVQDGIDILIDLAGHTAGCRLPVLAMKPAPIQVSYLGYPGTTGLATIDYRLTDAYADPPGMTESQYTETLIRLPRTLACYVAPNAPAVGELPALRPERSGRITFASFSSLTKIAPETIDLWAQALRCVPNSRLAIMARGADGAEFGRRIVAAFAAENIDPARIELRPSAAIEHYLAFHNEVDVLLDTFPFNGHTTLCHALWMGVPVVSRAGDRFASRLGLSVLNNAGLPQLVADTPEKFGQIAADLVHDLPRLGELRRGLRQQLSQSSLMDRRQFAIDFEQALRHMAQVIAG